ncbi:MAG: alpha/beta fold hydrolase [Kineosporiaceae bacterium]
MGAAAETAPLEPWVQYTRPAPAAETVLVCFPYAGGAASAYREWVPQLAAHGVEVWPVQLTGREGRFREAPTTELSVVAEHIIALLDRHLDGRSYAVFGHSAGAYMAYLLASLGSRRSGRVPLHVFVSASRPPSRPDPDFPIHQLPREPFLAKMFGYGRMPVEVLDHPDLAELVIATARADLQLVETFPWASVPELDCPVTALVGNADASVPVATQEEWRRITRGPFASVVIPGGHFPSATAQGMILEVIRRALC